MAKGIGDDWEATSSSVYAVTQPGMTQVVFRDPLNIESPITEEFDLGGLELEDIVGRGSTKWSYQHVKDLAKDPEGLKKNNELLKAIEGNIRPS